MKAKFALRLVFLFLIFVANSAWTEQDERVVEKLEEAKQRLNLSDEQVVSIKPILVDDLAEKKGVLLKHGIDLESGKRPAGGMNFRSARALANDMDSVRKKTIKKLSAYLNEDQMKEYKRMQKENKEKIREQIKESR